MTITFVATQEALSLAVKEWQEEKELAIDLECDNNLHHYGVTLSLAQVSNGKKHWVVDLLALKNTKGFKDVLYLNLTVNDVWVIQNLQVLSEEGADIVQSVAVSFGLITSNRPSRKFKWSSDLYGDVDSS